MYRPDAWWFEPFRAWRKIAFVYVARVMVLRNEQQLVVTLLMSVSVAVVGIDRDGSQRPCLS